MAPALGILGILTMTALGMKRGAVPMLRLLLVFVFSFFLAYGLKEPLFPLVQKIFRKLDPAWIECIAYLVAEAVCFGVLLYMATKFANETIPLPKVLDSVGGFVFGMASGLALAGLVLVTILQFPGGRGLVSGGMDWYFCPQDYLLRGFAHLSQKSIPGRRVFDAARQSRDLLFGTPVLPAGKSGFWVTSVPLGLRVYVCEASVGNTPKDFKRDVEGRLGKSELTARLGVTKRRRRIEGYIGRTPCYILQEVPDKLVAVEVPLTDGLEAGGQSPFLWDGEIGWWSQEAQGQKVVVKMYRMPKEKMKLFVLVAAFVPRGPEGVEIFERWLPGKPGLAAAFDPAEAQKKIAELTSAADAERYVDWLKRGGKAVFEATTANEIIAIQITGDRQLRQETHAAPYSPPALSGK